MNVVYDLRYATDHFPGIGTHAHALLTALLALPGKDRYRVVWGESDRTTRFDLDVLSRHPRVDWTVVREPSMGWNAVVATGGLLRRLGGDVYLSPFYLRPLGAPMPSVLTLFDVMYLTPVPGIPAGVRLRSWLAMRRARGAAAVITSSEFARGQLIEHGFPTGRIHVVRLALPPVRPGAAQRPPRAPERPFALVVGINRPHKGLRTLVNAWKSFGAEGPLDLVSAGPIDARYPSLADLAREAGAAGTHTLGAVTPGELEWLYANATLLVFATRHEGFGLPLLEAAGRGVPVVASDIPALREIGDGVARFVPPDDALAWSSAVRDLAGDAPARTRMAADGRALAARHDYAVVAARTRDILESVARTAERAAS